MKPKIKDNLESDLEDIPMAYLWYVILAIMAIVAAAGSCGYSIVLKA